MKKSIHNDEYRVFIRTLRILRESNGITQDQLATKLNVSQAIISKIESCERRLDLIETRIICQALNTSFQEFIKSVEDELSKK